MKYEHRFSSSLRKSNWVGESDKVTRWVYLSVSERSEERERVSDHWLSSTTIKNLLKYVCYHIFREKKLFIREALKKSILLGIIPK